MSENSEQRIQRGDRYELPDFGEVRVIDFSERTDAVSADGDVEETVLVKFDHKPDDEFTLGWHLKTWELDTFLESADRQTTDGDTQ